MENNTIEINGKKFTVMYGMIMQIVEHGNCINYLQMFDEDLSEEEKIVITKNL